MPDYRRCRDSVSIIILQRKIFCATKTHRLVTTFSFKGHYASEGKTGGQKKQDFSQGARR